MKIFLIGAGMGTPCTLTLEAQKAINESNLIIGSERMVSQYALKNADKFISYKPDEVTGFLNEHSGYKNVSILFSGDIGFYSGAEKMLEALKEYDVSVISGVSSLAYFCGKCGIPWDNVDFTSIHGQKKSLIQHIRYNLYVFSLLSGGHDIAELCSKLCYYGMGNAILHIGENLSYPDERITAAKARDIDPHGFGSLCVILAENKNFVKDELYGIDDSEFIRGSVPMTKSAVRAACIDKLKLKPDSVLYDVGAGTGSVSIEAALKSPEIQVYAIEKNHIAARLIKLNRRKIVADNVQIAEGSAPEIFRSLPAPTHVFIGGSGGKLEDIISAVWSKSPDARIVLNAVSVETVAEVSSLAKKHHLNADIFQITAAHTHEAGGYHLMRGQDPVFIISLEKGEKA